MTPEDRQIYGGLLHSREMEVVLTDLVTYINQQISLESIVVQNSQKPPEDLKQKFVISRIGVAGDFEGEILFAITLNLALAFSSCMLGLSETATKKYLEEENYDADMKDASSEIFNLTTGAVEKAMRKHLDMSVNCSQKETLLVDFSSDEPLPESIQLAGDWVMQKASIASMGIDGLYFQMFPEPVAQTIASAMAENLNIEDAKKQFEATASLKIGETKDKSKVLETKKIMVIEDTHLVRRLMVDHLKGAGYVVFEKSEGMAGVRWVTMMADEINLVILDVRLPDINGYQVIGILRKNEKTKSIPVMVCSSLTERKDLIQLKKLGITNVVIKPFTREILLSKVIHVIGRPPRT